MLRTTRQYVEVLSTGNGQLRVTRQYVEMLSETALPTSPSPSPSPSISLSPSPSISLSPSPSISLSPSPSISLSPSQSLSLSQSQSILSPSLSLSPSPSLSLSPSPSILSPSPSPSVLSPSPEIPQEMEPLRTVDAFLSDLMTRRGSITVSGNPNRFGIEMAGGHVVEMTPYEPDAATYRGWYYYNTASNLLMRKVIVDTKPVVVAYWKQISN